MTASSDPVPAGAGGAPTPWRTIVVAWGIYWLINTAQQQIAWQSARGYFPPFWVSMVLQYPLAACWALATPAILRLGRRFPFDRGRWPLSAAVHVVLSLSWVFLLSAFYIWHSANTMPMRPMATPFLRRAVEGFIVWSLSDALLYWIVLAAGWAAAAGRRAREQALAAAQLETRLAQADLHSLKMQLQPHFLFNALNTIGSLVRTGDRDEAVRVVARLGDLLRGLLDGSNRQVVPLREELAFIRNYLEIEEARFRDRLAVTMSVDEDVQDALVPHLILQPLVENAVKHGIAARRSAGHLEVSARRINDRLHLLVQDDGPGLDDLARPGIGLSNTHARLARLYGKDYELDVANAPGGGFLSRITVPLTGAGVPLAAG